MFAQNLQQSRSFGSTFKFPEGGAAPGSTAPAPSGNPGFSNEADDDEEESDNEIKVDALQTTDFGFKQDF